MSVVESKRKLGAWLIYRDNEAQIVILEYDLASSVLTLCEQLQPAHNWYIVRTIQ